MHREALGVSKEQMLLADLKRDTRCRLEPDELQLRLARVVHECENLGEACTHKRETQERCTGETQERCTGEMHRRDAQKRESAGVETWGVTAGVTCVGGGGLDDLRK